MKLLLPFAIATALCIGAACAQDNKSGVTSYYRQGKGVGLVANDSSFSLNFQFRMQNRATYNTISREDLEPAGFEFRVRRLRMKFEGFVADPRLTYYIQLSFSRGDMDWRGPDNSSVNSSPNVVRDAVVYYAVSKNLRLGFGQTKLPGNRQRVVSSGDLQFSDRSIVNAALNIDRDFGFFANYTGNGFNLKGALTSGEGRNSVLSDEGLAYTGRIELLPLGRFTGTNDYIEGDLAREPTPKLSIAATYHFNDKAQRQAGQTGNDLFQSRSLVSMEADVLLKYNGWAFYNEYMNRSTSNPITINPSDITKTRSVAAGQGFLTQLSYLFKNNFELAGRYAQTRPNAGVYSDPAFPSVNIHQLEQFEGGVTKYVKGHRMKVQGNLIYYLPTDLRTGVQQPGSYSVVFQVEIGI
ncbi:MAG: porin [Cytophagales bacterium]|nr:porin [Cytophagales bacterium]